jgi:hypothetical protein
LYQLRSLNVNCATLAAKRANVNCAGWESEGTSAADSGHRPDYFPRK